MQRFWGRSFYEEERNMGKYERKKRRWRMIRRKCERTIDMKPCSLPESTEKLQSIYPFFTLALVR